MYIHICKTMGTPQSPNKIEWKEQKVKEDPRDIIVPIRMNFEEKTKIKKRADKTGKNFSTFIRDCAIRLWN